MTDKKIECVKNITNWSSVSQSDRFESKLFDPKKFLKKISINSPKLASLLKNIRALDEKDFKNEKTLYKHYIYTDLKRSNGVKIIASAMIAAGYNLCYKKDGSFKIKENSEDNFLILSSTKIYDKPFSQKKIKNTLEIFNERPSNTHGENVRFIIIDSGFKEGVDLFDVKYCHILEEYNTQSDLTQAVGRGLRNCGQKGLEFKKNKGWELKVFIYDSVVPGKWLWSSDVSLVKKLKEKAGISQRDKELKELDDLLIKNSLDYLLTKQDSEINYLKIITVSSVALGVAALTALKLRKK